jgi:tripeptide aminopeptidase
VSRPAGERERRQLGELFAELCAIPSVSGDEAAMAERCAGELRALGFPAEPDAAGNLLARVPSARAPDAPGVLLCAHMDTVPHEGPVEPVLVDGGWESAGDTILGADNKAAVAVFLQAARRWEVEPPPVPVELLLTVREEVALEGAKAFDATRLRSAFGYVYDHASPIGEVVMASPTYFRLEASFTGRAAHAGIRPEAGRSAVVAAARAIAAMRLGRLDEGTTANVGHVHGGPPGATNVVPERALLLAEARSLDDDRAEALVAEMVDHCYDAANEPACACDLDVGVERLFGGYRHRPSAPQVAVAERALERCGFTPRRIATGGGSDANALEAQGFPCTNLANGTEANHEPAERVSVAALEAMLDVTFALLDEAAQQG